MLYCKELKRTKNIKLSYILTGIVALLIVGGTIAFARASNANTKSGTTQRSSDHDHEMHSFTPSSYKTLEACEAFTLDEARQLLGSQTAQNQSAPSSVTDDIATETCDYTGTHSVTVTIRSALNASTAGDEQHAFNDAHTADQMVDGFGEHAYYEHTRNELNIYDTNHWITIAVANVESDQAGLRLTKSVAQAIL